MKLKILQGVARWLFILMLPVLFLTASIAITLNSSWVYTSGFNKYGISQVTGLADSELQKAADGLISYFNSSDEYINVTVIKDGKPFTLFNQREAIHLKDLKGLIQLDYRILLGTLLYGMIYTGLAFRKKDRRQLARSVLIASGISLSLLIILGIGSVFNFDQLFLQFHLISFANNFWMLDPAHDYLIMLFPENFFYDYVLITGAITAVIAVILGGISWKYLRASQKQNHQSPLKSSP